MANDASGFDMERTIDWYIRSGVSLPDLLYNKPFNFQIENDSNVLLSREELGGLLHLFHQNARARSILRKVVGKPATWFHKDSTGKNPKPTTNPEDALSPTAIIPSYIDYDTWVKTKVPSADIHLYALPENIQPQVRRIIAAEGFVHEVAHSIFQPALYSENYKLLLPDERIVDGFDAMLQFAKLAEHHPPISHYASTYREPDNKFPSESQKMNTAISEEMAETVAAYILGFAFCGDDNKGKNPFRDRPQIHDLVGKLLRAQLVK